MKQVTLLLYRLREQTFQIEPKLRLTFAKKPAVAAFVFMALALALVCEAAHAQSEEDFQVRQNPDNTLTIIGYTGMERNVVIPETLFGLRVTAIGENAFRDGGNSGVRPVGSRPGTRRNFELYSVVIPDSVRRIEESAFARAGLRQVHLGNGVQYLGGCSFFHLTGAFHSNYLTEIYIPASVTEFTGAFMNNRLTRVVFAEGSRITKIPIRAFRDNHLSEITLPASVQVIGEQAFAGNHFSELPLPASVQVIEAGAFARNRFTSINLPPTVRRVYQDAFRGNTIETLVIPEQLARGHLARGAFVPIPRSGWGPGDPIVIITRLTIPARMDEQFIRDIMGDRGRNHALQEHFQSFFNFWENQNRAGGTYFMRGPIWFRE